ncbi:hypothetical protein PMIN03_003921 [Paraphaeosphaeria minitans]
MDRKRSTPELNTGLASPIKMLPSVAHSHGSPAKPTFLPERSTLLSNGPPVSPTSSRVPDITLQRASGSLRNPFTHQDDAPATWTCCVCDTQNPVFIHAGPHPLGALACDCTHKPCSVCSIAGRVKPFLPMDEPAMVPCSSSGSGSSSSSSSSPDASGSSDASGKQKDTEKEELRFGILCPACGLSWRAREFGKRWSKTLRKMPSVSLQHVRAAHLVPEHRLRKSRSTLVLGNKRIITPPGHTGEKQAEYAAVKFSGVGCTCGTTITLGAALCFQIFVVEGGERKEADGKEMVEAKMKIGGEEKSDMWKGSSVGWTTTPELKEKGHGTPTLRLLGGKHPNPLRSSPVVDKMARDSWEEKCDKEGWV